MKKWILILFIFGLSGCFKKTVKSPKEIDFSKLPYKTLSEYGLFTGNIHDLKEAEGVIPYEPIASLFTDYAFKKRFVWVPVNTNASIPDDPDLPLSFPNNTILVKNFYYPADFSKPEENIQIVETRLLIKIADKWEAFPYLWNKEQTEATLKNIGAVVPVQYTNLSGERVALDYVVPQKTQCRSCHYRDEVLLPIGPKAKQLNHEITYNDGHSNQLEKWVSLGVLKTDKEIAQIKSLVDPFEPTNTLTDRARSYLDANCSNCHTVHGPASTSGLYLNAEESDPFHLGIMKSPVAAGMGGGGFKFDVYPGKGKESILTYRMNSTHPGVMMPELGRVSIHKEAVELISKWIDEMKVK